MSALSACLTRSSFHLGGCAGVTEGVGRRVRYASIGIAGGFDIIEANECNGTGGVREGPRPMELCLCSLQLLIPLLVVATGAVAAWLGTHRLISLPTISVWLYISHCIGPIETSKQCVDAAFCLVTYRPFRKARTKTGKERWGRIRVETRGHIEKSECRVCEKSDERVGARGPVK